MNKIEKIILLFAALFLISLLPLSAHGLSFDEEASNPGNFLCKPAIKLAAISTYINDPLIMASQNFECPQGSNECHTSSCKDSNGRNICCPSGNPYLNPCDCFCYGSEEAALNSSAEKCEEVLFCN